MVGFDELIKEEIAEEAREEGRVEGAFIVVEKLYKDNAISLAAASAAIGLTQEEFLSKIRQDNEGSN